MKIYWTSDLGCVVTSANLSTNALGAGGLKEFGVLLAKGAIKIKTILDSIKPRDATPAALDALEKRHKAYVAANPGRVRRSRRTDTFQQWFALRPGFRPKWKIGDFGTVAKAASKRTYAMSMEEYGRGPVEFITGGPRDYAQWDWVLKFRVHGGKVESPSWMCVSNIFRVPRSDKSYIREFPIEAVQNRPLHEYERPPFEIDKRFRSAFRTSLRLYGTEKIADLTSRVPPRSFLKELWRAYDRRE